MQRLHGNRMCFIALVGLAIATSKRPAAGQGDTDVGNPSAPTYHGSFNTPGDAVRVHAENGSTLVADLENGFWILQFIGGAPRIQSAALVDANNDGFENIGDQLILTLTRSVNVTTTALQASHFHLPVTGDSLGGAGFAVDVNPFNSRQIAIRLGSGVTLTPFGEFSTTSLTAGSPSAIDFASSLPAGSIMSLDGLLAVDGGAPRVDDTGIDVLQNFFGLQADLDVSGGTVPVVPSSDAAYLRHEMVIPPGALSALTQFRMQPPPVNLGVVGAFWLESSNPTITFNTPATITAEFLEGDIDFERGQVASGMRVHQLIETPTLGFHYVRLPGPHTVVKGSPKGTAGKSSKGAGGEPQKLQSTSGTVSVQVNSLNPGGSVGIPGMFAGIPIETVDEKTIHIRPISPGGVAKQAGVILSPGLAGIYTLHKIEFNGYEQTTASDPMRYSATIRTALLAERVSSSGGQSFPTDSGAIFALDIMDASSQPVQFSDPVNLTVQFMPTLADDLVRFSGSPGMPGSMRLVRDQGAGASVDFDFLTASNQIVDAVQGTVTLNNLTTLTGADGKGFYGAVIPEPAEIERWKEY